MARSRRADEWSAPIQLHRGSVMCLLRHTPRARRLRLTVDPVHGLVVTVPAGLARSRTGAERTARDFALEREEWLWRHLDRRQSRLAALELAGGLRDGAVLAFRGEEHTLRIVPSAARRSSVARHGGDDGDEIVVSMAAREARPIGAILEAWCRDRARTAISREIGRHAPGLGVAARAVTIRDQKTRWGSCSRQGRLSFSWRLVLAPPEVLETVVVHELAHLRVFGHGPQFWSIVASRIPEHRRWRKWLRDHSLELHAALGVTRGVS